MRQSSKFRLAEKWESCGKMGEVKVAWEKYFIVEILTMAQSVGPSQIFFMHDLRVDRT